MWLENVMWCILGLSLAFLLCLSAWMEWKRHKAYMEVQKRQLEFFRIFHVWALNDLRTYTCSQPTSDFLRDLETLESMLIFD